MSLLGSSLLPHSQIGGIGIGFAPERGHTWTAHSGAMIRPATTLALAACLCPAFFLYGCNPEDPEDALGIAFGSLFGLAILVISLGACHECHRHYKLCCGRSSGDGGDGGDGVDSDAVTPKSAQSSGDVGDFTWGM